MSRKKIDRVGERRINKQRMLMEITRYYNNKNVVVTFLGTGEAVRCRYDQFLKGDVKATKFPVKKKHILLTVIAGIVAVVVAVSLLIFGIKTLFF